MGVLVDDIGVFLDGCGCGWIYVCLWMDTVVDLYEKIHHFYD